MKMYDEFELDLTNEESTNRVGVRGISRDIVTAITYDVTKHTVLKCTRSTCGTNNPPTHKDCKNRTTVNTCRTL